MLSPVPIPAFALGPRVVRSAGAGSGSDANPGSDAGGADNENHRTHRHALEAHAERPAAPGGRELLPSGAGAVFLRPQMAGRRGRWISFSLTGPPAADRGGGSAIHRHTRHATEAPRRPADVEGGKEMRPPARPDPVPAPWKAHGRRRWIAISCMRRALSSWARNENDNHTISRHFCGIHINQKRDVREIIERLKVSYNFMAAT